MVDCLDSLRLLRCRPSAIGQAFHPHTSARGVAVDPAGQPRGATALELRELPLRVEAQLHVATAPRSGNGASITEVARPSSIHLTAIAFELESTRKVPGVARQLHLPR